MSVVDMIQTVFFAIALLMKNWASAATGSLTSKQGK
jgi:hypothetical protein